MTTLFSNYSAKIPKPSIFGPKFNDFYFCSKLSNKANSRTQVSNMTIAFSNSSPKICKSGIFGPKFRHFFFFYEILQLDKFGVLISNMTILFSNSSPKYPNKAFLVPNLGIFAFFHDTIFVFVPNFAIRQIRGRRFRIWQYYFQIPHQKYANQAFLVPNLRIFILH